MHTQPLSNNFTREPADNKKVQVRSYEGIRFCKVVCHFTRKRPVFCSHSISQKRPERQVDRPSDLWTGSPRYSKVSLDTLQELFPRVVVLRMQVSLLEYQYHTSRGSTGTHKEWAYSSKPSSHFFPRPFLWISFGVFGRWKHVSAPDGPNPDGCDQTTEG